jgi:molecular chaperone DnaK (HSP70)
MLFNLSTLEVVITLPAIWPHYAQARMRKAARDAGILDDHVAGPTTLRFISEPEAAAIATLQDMTDRPDIKVCAGGKKIWGRVRTVTDDVVARPGTT